MREHPVDISVFLKHRRRNHKKTPKLQVSKSNYTAKRASEEDRLPSPSPKAFGVINPGLDGPGVFLRPNLRVA